QLAAEVGGVALAVPWMVQNGVDVMEDVPLRDGAVAVASAKLFQRPVGDVLTAVGAVFGVGVEREALRTALGKLVCDYVRCEREKTANLHQSLTRSINCRYPGRGGYGGTVLDDEPRCRRST